MALKNSLPQHILVIRNSAMGDVAMLPHALRAMRSAYPEVQLTVLTRAHLQPLFAGIDVDFLTPDYKGRHKGLVGLWRLAREARAHGIDAVADVHGVLRARLVCTLLRLHGIRVAHIDKGRREKQRQLGNPSKWNTPLKHTVTRYCDVFRKLGFEVEDPTPATKPPLTDIFGPKQGVWVGVAPFSAQVGKCYPLDEAARVVEGLSARCERVFVHSGKSGEESDFAKRMECRYRNVTALYDKVQLREELQLIARLDCLVSMDSLAMHMASLVATPVVSVWGATHPSLGFAGYGTSCEGVVQREDLPCRPCSVYGAKPCRFGDYRCMQIPAQEVLVHVAHILQAKKA